MRDPATRSRTGLAFGVGLPTVVLVAVAAALAGGATAATGMFGQGGQTANQVDQQQLRNQLAMAGHLNRIVMPPPKVNNQPAAPATPNMDCTLIVPADPLTAQGLATPFQLVATNAANGPCNEANPNQSAFVQGAIITPNGQLTLYDPLVVDQGTQPAAPPAAAQVPAGATVALWFGFNGNNLTLRSAAGSTALRQGRCVNGTRGSIFGQFSYCNAPGFFRVANADIQQNLLQIPAVGTANDGLPCPTVRDFSVVDQDQSDNVTTHYLAGANGQTAQNNAAARAALQQLGQNNPVDLANGSDNLLLNAFVLPTLGCQSFTRPDGSNDGQAEPSLPLDELSAAANQQAPVALVPLTDPMVLINNNQSTFKDNLYRAGVNQTPIGQPDNGNGATYCTNLFTNAAGIQRVFKDKAIFAGGTSPDPAAATNLFSFLAMRASASFTNLNCQGLTGLANPITLTMNGNGMVTDATFTAAGAAATGTATATQPAGAPSAGPTMPATAGTGPAMTPTGSATGTATVAPAAAATGTATVPGTAAGASTSATVTTPPWGRFGRH